ncbi:hypothetical protein TH61_11435 [Rufibacter sp. DG15C]|uniref:glycosyltransferase n=1 Tax=Rufibacter sp. DG15C TaxID=1379909 RepID=UPI00078E7967|nr:glycosyltransferase [Rufibacter sp. DG15C]AMM51667.1 hypothetical protein TH61_11435 [Rufibacter sp. DG15C]
MEGKRTVVHIIDGLARGGAETLLAGVVSSLHDVRHVIISLKKGNDFEIELKGIDIWFLDFKWFHSIPSAVFAIKKILRKYKVDIIHSHLFFSVIISRLVCSNKVVLINSYHAVLYGKEGADYPIHARLLDRITYNERIITLCVSNGVRMNLGKYIGIRNNIYVLYNFIADSFFNNYRLQPNLNSHIKVVCVGNLKPDKNYQIIIKAISLLSSHVKNRISLDIFGQGGELTNLHNKCKELEINNIHFKGIEPNIANKLPKYDFYILSSRSEGFGLAVIEAMAIGLPALVSNLPVLREVTNEKAIYFNHENAEELASLIEEFSSGKFDLQSISYQGHLHASNFTKRNYLKELMRYYQI